MSHYPESSCLQGTEASQSILIGLGRTCAHSLGMQSTPTQHPSFLLILCFLRERKGLPFTTSASIPVSWPFWCSSPPPPGYMPLYSWKGTI